MKNIVLILCAIVIAAFSSCGDKMEKEVVTKHHNDAAKKVHHFVYRGNEKIVKKVTLYTINGNKEKEGELKDNKKDGIWSYWYIENGQKWMEESYENGLLDGQTTVWYKSGEKEYVANYKKGKPHGEWIFYDADGNKTKKAIYENGKKISTEDY